MIAVLLPVLLALLAATADANIGFAVADCGEPSICTMTSVVPNMLTQGIATAVIGRGTSNSTVRDGTFEMKIKAVGFTLQTITGDICSRSTVDLPMGVGYLVFGGLSCPMAQGPLAILVKVYVSALVPSSLARMDIAFIARTRSGSPLLCATFSTHALPSAMPPTTIHSRPGQLRSQRFDLISSLPRLVLDALRDFRRRVAFTISLLVTVCISMGNDCGLVAVGSVVGLAGPATSSFSGSQPWSQLRLPTPMAAF